MTEVRWSRGMIQIREEPYFQINLCDLCGIYSILHENDEFLLGANFLSYFLGCACNKYVWMYVYEFRWWWVADSIGTCTCLPICWCMWFSFGLVQKLLIRAVKFGLYLRGERERSPPLTKITCPSLPHLGRSQRSAQPECNGKASHWGNPLRDQGIPCTR